MMAIDHEKHDIVDQLIKKRVRMDATDSIHGNTALHIAAMKGDITSVGVLYKEHPEGCLASNYEGETPIHLAIKAESLECLRIMEKYKAESLNVKNRDGENPLFPATRIGNKAIFKWFMGKIEFFQARGN